MMRYVPIGVAVVLIVVSAYVQGKWSERWGYFPELAEFAQRVGDVPMVIGQWKGEAIPEPTEAIKKVAGAVGSLSRTYRNSAGDQVSIFIVCGRLQDVFYHTPDRCYPAAGFDMADEIVRERIETPAGIAEFYTTNFTKSEPTHTQNLRLYWSWSANGPWSAPSTPKWSFAGQRALYKVYVVTPFTKKEDNTDKNPATDFIRVLMPELQQAFFPNAPVTAPAVKTPAAETEEEAA
jgi:hypothetical protein